MSSTSATPIANFTILAFEPDQKRAEAIRRIVASRTHAGFTRVDSKDGFLDALRDGPDVILLPALLPPADESQILDVLRDSQDGRHLEVLVTPFSLRSEADVEAPKSGWRRLLSKATSLVDSEGDPRAFGERLVWALRCAKEARRERAEQFDAEGEPTLSSSQQDRRVYRRYSPSELPWLQQVRLKDGPDVKILDLSNGGVLLESCTRLNDGELELVGTFGELLVPFRVVRCQPFAHDGSVFLSACAFPTYFDFDKEQGPAVDKADLSTGVLAAYARSDERHERDPRLTAGEVPWLSNVKLAWGPEVDLVNISRTGMLVETTSKFTPGTSTEFRLNGPETALAVPARIVRSEVANVSARGVKYQAAVMFTKEVKFPRPPCHDEALTPKALADVLTDALSDVHGGNGDVRGKFVQGLRKIVGAEEIEIRSTPRKPISGEAFFFRVPGVNGSQAVLQATYQSNYPISEVEFRCLQTAAVLATSVLEFERLLTQVVPAASSFVA